MNYWETEERYDTPGKRLAELERELRHERDEYAKLWQMYGDLEDERDRLREALENVEAQTVMVPQVQPADYTIRQIAVIVKIALQEVGDE